MQKMKSDSMEMKKHPIMPMEMKKHPMMPQAMAKKAKAKARKK